MRRQLKYGFLALGFLLCGSASAAPAKKAAVEKKAPAKKAAVEKKAPAKKAAVEKKAPAKKAAALAGPLADAVEAYVAKHKLKERVVQVNLVGRKVTRTFVPVIEGSYPDFMKTFGTKSKSLVLRMYEYDRTHSHLFFDLDKGIKHGNIWHAAPNAKGRFADIREQGQLQGGRFIAMNLGDKLLEGATEYFEKATEPAGNKSGCMWWLTNAKAGKEPLAHALGVSRSIDPGNLVAKMVHAGNERVAVIGVPVKTLAEFNAMTDAKLMGAPPAGGAMEAMRD